MHFEFIDDFKSVVWKENGIVHCVPVDSLDEQEKKFIYEEIAKEKYA
jgi:hypothetical protein